MGKQVTYGGGGVQSNMCSCVVRVEHVTTRGCTCIDLLSTCRYFGKMLCGKVRTLCMCLFVYLRETELVIYR